MIVSNHPKRLRDDQRRRLDLLHEKLEAVVSVREEEYLRTEGALLGSTEWQDLRELAREALRSFGWPLEAPPKGKHRFIGPDGAFLPPTTNGPDGPAMLLRALFCHGCPCGAQFLLFA